MASPYPISNRYKITSVDHGQILKLGNAADGFVGTYEVMFVPDATFTGNLAVVGRIDHKDAQADSVPFVSVPFRKVYFNSAPPAVGYEMSVVGDLIVSTSLIQVPSSAITVGVLVECSEGFGYLYSKPLDGPASP